jgi:hypothetical protein
VINIIYGSASGLTSAGSQLFSGGFIDFEAGKNFGAALSTGDFNGDGFTEVAVGIPGDNSRAGAVSVMYGSGSGITSAGKQFFTQGSGIADAAEAGDLFGFALPGSSGPAGAGLTGIWQQLVQACNGQGPRLSCVLQGTFIVTNPGTQRAANSVLRFFLSADANLDETDIVLSEVAIGTLEAGETKSRQLNVHLPPRNSASGQFVIAFADADNVVAETNEENNIVPFGPIE